MADEVEAIRERYLQVQDRIAAAARGAGLDPYGVRLVVVCKSQPLQVVQAAVAAGITLLGENYPEEGAMKIQSPGMRSDVEWHMIGHVQSRKAGLVARHFDMLHSLDGLKLAERLNRLLGEQSRTLPILLEFNVGQEASKHGWTAHDESRWDELLPAIAPIFDLRNLQIRGLMCMPPLEADPEAARPYFQKLRTLRDYLTRHMPDARFTELSMGTSADFEIAVQEGATLVRVGTAILGPRP
jgi:PLP dependent protein